MQPSAVVESFNVEEDVGLRFGAGTISCSVYQLRFERAEKTLHRSLVVAVPFAAHARSCIDRTQPLLKKMAGVLAATVEMMQQAISGIALLDSHIAVSYTHLTLPTICSV